jgi:hypothetical protein
VGHPLHPNQAEQAGQPARVTRLAPWAQATVRAGDWWVCAGSDRILLAAGAQVEVILQQLPQQCSPGMVQMFFQLGVAPKRCQLALQSA